MNTPVLIRLTRKNNGTLILYFQQWCSQWTISWTPFLKEETSARRVVTPAMAAHIIKMN